jgi:hypothetical protein
MMKLLSGDVKTAACGRVQAANCLSTRIAWHTLEESEDDVQD